MKVNSNLIYKCQFLLLQFRLNIFCFQCTPLKTNISFVGRWNFLLKWSLFRGQVNFQEGYVLLLDSCTCTFFLFTILDVPHSTGASALRSVAPPLQHPRSTGGLVQWWFPSCTLGVIPLTGGKWKKGPQPLDIWNLIILGSTFNCAESSSKPVHSACILVSRTPKYIFLCSHRVHKLLLPLVYFYAIHIIISIWSNATVSFFP